MIDHVCQRCGQHLGQRPPSYIGRHKNCFSCSNLEKRERGAVKKKQNRIKCSRRGYVRNRQVMIARSVHGGLSKRMFGVPASQLSFEQKRAVLVRRLVKSCEASLLSKQEAKEKLGSFNAENADQVLMSMYSLKLQNSGVRLYES